MDRAQPSPELQRRLGLGSVTSLVVANMVGAGIFTTSGLLMADLGDAGLMLALWLVGGVVALCGALCYGELGAAIPRAGGEVAILSELYHPAAGFLSGWVSLFAGFSAPIAASGIGVAEYLAQAAPAVVDGLGGADSPATTAAKKILAIAVIAVFTVIHRRGLELGAKVQNWLTALKVALVVGLVVVGFALGGGDIGRLTGGIALPKGLADWRSAGLALMWIMFAYSGWNAAAYIGSEIRRPERILPRALLAGTLAVAALYLAVNVLYVWAVPADELAGVISVASLAVSRVAGPGATVAVSLVVAFALLSSLSAFMILGPRVYYAMAADGQFFRSIARVHPRYGVPSRSIVLQGVLAALMVLLGTFDQILTYMGFALGLAPLLAVLGVFRLRRRGRSVAPMPGHPLPALVYLTVSSAILVLAYLERPLESSLALAMVAAGVPAWWLFRSRTR